MTAIALLDLDGTVADYDGAANREMEKLKSPYEVAFTGARDAEPSWLKARRALVTRRPGFWKNLPELPLGMSIYKLLVELGFEVHVLTKGPRSKTKARVWMEKVDWCHEHLPQAKITITEDKSLVYGRVLVDDLPAYFLPWAEKRPRGLVLVPPHPWNADPKLYHKSLIYRVENFHEATLRVYLTAARDRKNGEPL